MHANSRTVSSSQNHTHGKLPALLRRHLANVHRKPVASHNVAAFQAVLKALSVEPRPLILDSFCGTGHSTLALAQQHPQHLVVGIDQSAHRLAKHPAIADNYLLLQAECEDIWQLLLGANLTLDRHYLLYPNPWPKPKHLQRRIHGCAAFPSFLQLGGQVELRSNWGLYVEEFGLAMQLAGFPGTVCRICPVQPLTLFEAKYLSSGHDLWAFRGRIRRTGNRDELANIGYSADMAS